MEVEPRIVKQYKCHHCGSSKKYQGKGMEGGKKCGVKVMNKKDIIEGNGQSVDITVKALHVPVQFRMSC